MKRVTWKTRRKGCYHIPASTLIFVNIRSMHIFNTSLFELELKSNTHRLIFAKEGSIWVAKNLHLYKTNCGSKGDYLQWYPDYEFIVNRSGPLLMRKITRFELLFS